MTSTVRFHNDHVVILTLMRKISALMGKDAQFVTKNAIEIDSNLIILSNILKVHLADEDNSLYPKLAAHSNSNLAETAKRFQYEMNGILAKFKRYSSKWNADTITHAPSRFHMETLRIFETIGNRIGQEERVLYAMFDRINAL